MAIDETSLIANEPVTVILSTGGFVRSAKGHEIDPRTLSYKTGDAFQGVARGKSLQNAIFMDSTGRTYTLPAHSLPSARGNGEPLSGRLNPPDGAKFVGVIMGEPEDLWLLASDAGYGFTVRLKELITDRRAGKTRAERAGEVARSAAGVRRFAGFAGVRREQRRQDARVQGGRSARDAAGKGNKIFDIPGRRRPRVRKCSPPSRWCRRTASSCCGPATRRRRSTGPSIKEFKGQRAQRGSVLMRGWREIDRLEGIPG